jgi:hypothetical protein
MAVCYYRISVGIPSVDELVLNLRQLLLTVDDRLPLVVISWFRLNKQSQVRV